jgi:hypothetical protein
MASTTPSPPVQLCFNQSNPLQVVPCPPPPAPSFLDQWLWTIILAGVVFCLALTCAILSYWKYTKKKEVFIEREEKRKKKLQENFKKQLDEKKRQADLAKANRMNQMEQL